mgnify:CR=1 FL=1
MAVAKMLIADDNKQITSILSNYARKEGFEPVVALDGEEALRLFDEHEPDIAMVLLDVMMPKVDGFEVCRRLRGKSLVPVIMVTAKEAEFDKVKGLEGGADDYITKPFNPVEVMARVRSQLRRYAQLGGMEQKPTALQIGGIRLDDEAKARYEHLLKLKALYE